MSEGVYILGNQHEMTNDRLTVYLTVYLRGSVSGDRYHVESRTLWRRGRVTDPQDE